MMWGMKDIINDALNLQIRLEFESAFAYLSWSVSLRELGLSGAGHWMRQQYREECAHALRFLTFLEERNARVSVPAIAAHEYEWTRPLDLFRLALVQERRITAAIHRMIALCQESGDYATQGMLFDFAREQHEEERQVEDVLKRFTLIDGNVSALLSLDNQLAQRRESSDSSWV